MTRCVWWHISIALLTYDCHRPSFSTRLFTKGLVRRFTAHLMSNPTNLIVNFSTEPERCAACDNKNLTNFDTVADQYLLFLNCVMHCKSLVVKLTLYTTRRRWSRSRKNIEIWHFGCASVSSSHKLVECLKWILICE